MSELPLTHDLSKYNRYILNRILDRFTADKEFNIYELVEESVSYKCILPSQNELVMETYYTIKEHLLLKDFIIEKKEMIAYVLTGKGVSLKACGSIEKYEEMEMKKQKKSIFHNLFSKKPKNDQQDRQFAQYYE